jgi:hypothetical protein
MHLRARTPSESPSRVSTRCSRGCARGVAAAPASVTSRVVRQPKQAPSRLKMKTLLSLPCGARSKGVSAPRVCAARDAAGGAQRLGARREAVAAVRGYLCLRARRQGFRCAMRRALVSVQSRIANANDVPAGAAPPARTPALQAGPRSRRPAARRHVRPRRTSRAPPAAPCAYPRSCLGPPRCRACVRAARTAPSTPARV